MGTKCINIDINGECSLFKGDYRHDEPTGCSVRGICLVSNNEYPEDHCDVYIKIITITGV